ncbi:phage tail assembly chaperone [Pelagerythrobacter sp.]|uniref:phage tail assembly chaperone n=1 Tax=Pelagerythrobacter sp. TaxID=2800702 RepID=UPI0035B3DE79
MSTFAAAALPLCALAARGLGWRPGDFWAATPAELASCLADPGTPAAAAMGRDELATLMERDGDG